MEGPGRSREREKWWMLNLGTVRSLMSGKGQFQERWGTEMSAGIKVRKWWSLGGMWD